MSLTRTTAKPAKANMKRRAIIIARLVIGLGIFGLVISILSMILQEAATTQDLVYFVVYALITLLGYHLTKFNLTALRVLRLLSWIDVVGGGIILLSTLSSIPFIVQMLNIVGGGALFGALLIVGFLIMQLMPVFSLLILIATHPPEFRKLFR